jgi:hypothetical protein
MHLNIFLHVSMKPTWYMGFTSSMWPKCPGQSAKFDLQVLQRRFLSTVPIRRSLIPPSAGFPSGSTTVVLSTLITELLS